MKAFYDKKPSKHFKRDVREFLKQFDVRVHFKQSGSCSAIEDKLIELDVRELGTVQALWSCVFHELAHIYCWRNNLFEIYHKETLPPKKFAKYIRRNGVRIEKHVDKIGERLMKDYFPDIPFMGCYESAGDVRWYRTWVKRNYPL